MAASSGAWEIGNFIKAVISLPVHSTLFELFVPPVTHISHIGRHKVLSILDTF